MSGHKFGRRVLDVAGISWRRGMCWAESIYIHPAHIDRTIKELELASSSWDRKAPSIVAATLYARKRGAITVKEPS